MKAVRPEREAADASAAIVANSAYEMAKKLAANRYAVGETDIAESVQGAVANGSPVIAGQPAPAPKPATGALSVGAMQVILAVRKVAPDGSWIDQKEIPHGLTGRAVSGYLAGLARRGLIQLRADKGGKFSARATAAGVALLVEAGP